MAGSDTLLQTPYATAMPFIVASTGGWSDEYDRQRLATYDLYDDLYNNDPTQYRMMLRGTDEKPIYIPTAKRLIAGLARYVGKGWGVKVMSGIDETGADTATPEQIAQAQIVFGKLFARERLLSKFRSGVPEWLRRGDWLWMITADPLKREGSRISINAVDPRRYFPRYMDPTDLGRLTGQEIIEETMVKDNVALQVQQWLKASDPEHPNYGGVEPEEGFPIAYSVTTYAVEDFNDPEKRKPLAGDGDEPLALLPGITQLPIYHIRNNESTDDPFGRSDLSGLESIVAGINQASSDEDLSLAMAGIGMFVTTSGSPIDETTKEAASWKLGPNRVIEIDEGTTFERIEGVKSIDPFQQHIGFLEDNAFGAAGLSDVSLGTAELSSGISGIALAISVSPTIDSVRVKNETLNGVFTQMFHDLLEWIDVFEGIDLLTVEVVSETDEPGSLLPFDREARWKELMEGVTAGVFTPEYAVTVLEAEFGYEFPPGYAATLTAANAAKAAASDPFGARTTSELADTPAEDVADAGEDGA